MISIFLFLGYQLLSLKFWIPFDSDVFAVDDVDGTVVVVEADEIEALPIDHTKR